jgi:uncharacterized membrane protein
MEEAFGRFASTVALAVEAAAALLIAVGAAEALIASLGRAFGRRRSGLGQKKGIWLRFAAWLMLALEFELAADVVRTAISPTWAQLGQLGAIAAIRTVLNRFLAKDIREAGEARPAVPEERAAGTPTEVGLH